MTTPLLIENVNLSDAWLKVLETIVEDSGKEISPLLISLTDFQESLEMRKALDDDMNSRGFPSIRTVSETIFPESLYQYCGRDRNKLYKEYKNNLPRIKKIDRGNKDGTYFERLIAYEGISAPINQLENIITSIQRGKIKRRSKLQASIFDPKKDHTNGPYQGFPCLQHISVYKTADNGLVLNSFYAIQWHYRRGYGNWLGLINLGKFIAEELDLEFERFNCYVGVEQLAKLKKGEAKILLEQLKGIQKL